jgi:tRNA U34 2-thiouridine synthase MnmA/TrmU
MIQAIGIFSGGLDSLLSARLLVEQGLDPTLLNCTSPFFPLEQARASARALGRPLIELDIYEELLAIIKNPPHGLGRRLNPCIDCHALMFRKAGEKLAESGQDGFLFSGEVLGQRPMSQNPQALKSVAQDSGRWGLVLRPLSAKLMPLTEAEEKGWVDRERLLGLNGRSRRPQMDLAEKWGLPVPPPAGGCLLTDVGYSRRFKWLLERPQGLGDPVWPPRRLAEIIKHGRLFSIEPDQWLVVGRKHSENQALTELSGPEDYIFRLEGQPGPTVLLPYSGRKPGLASLEMGCRLAAAYGDHGDRPEAELRIDEPGGGLKRAMTAVGRPVDWERFMIKNE